MATDRALSLPRLEKIDAGMLEPVESYGEFLPPLDLAELKPDASAPELAARPPPEPGRAG